MRTLAVVVFALIAVPAYAEPLDTVCGQLIGTQVTQCMAAGRGRYISPHAVDQCGKLIGTQVIDCVSAIAGKEYSAGEANTCGGLIGGQVVDCFRRTGHAHVVQAPPPPPPRGGPPSYPEIRAEIAAAIEQLRANDPRGAELRLQRLLSDMR